MYRIPLAFGSLAIVSLMVGVLAESNQISEIALTLFIVSMLGIAVSFFVGENSASFLLTGKEQREKD